MTTNERIQQVPIDALIVQQPSVALLDPAKKAELYAFLEREIEAFEPDLSTEAGRKKIAGLAYKIARTKSAIDDAGAALKSEWLKKSQEIDAGRREIREKLDALKERARAPLTRWETDEEQRTVFIQQTFEMFQKVVIVKATDTSESVTYLIKQTKEFVISDVVFGERWADAVNAQNAAVLSLRKSLAKIQEDEYDREELARLREEALAREQKDREAADAELQAKLTKASEEREIKRLADLAETVRLAEEKRAKIEAENIEKAKQEAEERTKRELQAKHEAELLAANQAKFDAEWKLKQEELRAVERGQEREQESARVKMAAEMKAKEDAKLAGNKKHRAQVIANAEIALVEQCNLTPDQATIVVKSIIAGYIPNVELRFV